MTLRDALAAAWQDLRAAWPWVLLILGLWIEAAIGLPWEIVAAAARGTLAIEWGPIEATYSAPRSLWQLHGTGLGAAEAADPVRIFAWPSRLALMYAVAWLVVELVRATRLRQRVSGLTVTLAVLAGAAATLDWLVDVHFFPVAGAISIKAYVVLHDAVARHVLPATLGTLLLAAILARRTGADDARWRWRLALVHAGAVLVTGLPETLRKTVGNVVMGGPMQRLAWLPIHVAGAAGLLLAVAWSVDPAALRRWPKRGRAVGVVFLAATLAVYGLTVLYGGLPSPVRTPDLPAEAMLRPFALAGKAAAAFLIIGTDLFAILTLVHLGRPDGQVPDEPVLDAVAGR